MLRRRVAGRGAEMRSQAVGNNPSFQTACKTKRKHQQASVHAVLFVLCGNKTEVLFELGLFDPERIAPWPACLRFNRSPTHSKATSAASRIPFATHPLPPSFHSLKIMQQFYGIFYLFPEDQQNPSFNGSFSFSHSLRSTARQYITSHHITS